MKVRAYHGNMVSPFFVGKLFFNPTFDLEVENWGGLVQRRLYTEERGRYYGAHEELERENNLLKRSMPRKR
jgi:hypothetical protein